MLVITPIFIVSFISTSFGETGIGICTNSPVSEFNTSSLLEIPTTNKVRKMID
jgi:hypothetical protein